LAAQERDTTNSRVVALSNLEACRLVVTIIDVDAILTLETLVLVVSSEQYWTSGKYPKGLTRVETSKPVVTSNNFTRSLLFKNERDLRSSHLRIMKYFLDSEWWANFVPCSLQFEGTLIGSSEKTSFAFLYYGYKKKSSCRFEFFSIEFGMVVLLQVGVAGPFARCKR
jgi:hypothetical protein